MGEFTSKEEELEYLRKWYKDYLRKSSGIKSLMEEAKDIDDFHKEQWQEAFSRHTVGEMPYRPEKKNDMNVYSYLDKELTSRGWWRDDNGQSVFYTNEKGKYNLEPLHDATINVIKLDNGLRVEVDLILPDDYDRIRIYS